MLGLIGTAIAGGIAGLGAGVARGAEQYGEYVARSTLAKEQAEIQRLRDERMAELETQRETAREGRAKAERLEVGEAVKKSKTAMVDDPSGTVREKTRAEQLLAERDVYAERGLVNESIRMDESISRDEDRRQRTLDRTADNARADRQLTEMERHNKAVEKIQAATAGRLAKGAELDNAIKEITLENARRVDGLRKEFASATPERKKAITEEIQIITGKDNDNYLPVPLKDDQGNITGYKVFDKKRGEWVEPKGAGDVATPKTEADVRALPEGALFRNPADGKVYRKKGGGPAAAQEAGKGSPPSASPRPQPEAGVTAYGPMTPWSTVEKQVRAGDKAAIDYARRRLARGSGFIGVEPPQSLVDYMKSLDANPGL